MTRIRTWSDSPFSPVVGRDDVPPAAVIAEDGGESTQVHEIAGHPGWLAKLYRKPLSEAASATLRTLVYMPTMMSEQDQTLVNTCVSWPVARICDGPHTVGVVMAKAPEQFYARLRSFDGRELDPAPLTLDLLLHSDEYCAKRGVRSDMSVRARAMLELLRVGGLFARHNIVYADWSYGNAFWELGTGAVFIIDMDTSGIGAREWIESMSWEDPLYPETTRLPLTVYSDRYKLAVLTVRCLTGERDVEPSAAHAVLLERLGHNPFHTALGKSLSASRPADRPSPQELLQTLERWMTATVMTYEPPEEHSAPNITGTVDLRLRTPGAAPPVPQNTPPVPDVVPTPPHCLGRTAVIVLVVVCIVIILLLSAAVG
ncbi:hypothetical protein AB0B50_21580 [Streptomyces sp. NPDC041068]|uniref:hypothetical protein n=1 Tax=Streptomyces sp. NPDC041068 TaxID=3155130 RepID=UPI0033F91BC9